MSEVLLLMFGETCLCLLEDACLYHRLDLLGVPSLRIRQTSIPASSQQWGIAWTSSVGQTASPTGNPFDPLPVLPTGGHQDACLGVKVSKDTHRHMSQDGDICSTLHLGLKRCRLGAWQPCWLHPTPQA